MAGGSELDKIVRAAEEFQRQESIKSEYQTSSDEIDDDDGDVLTDDPEDADNGSTSEEATHSPSMRRRSVLNTCRGSRLTEEQRRKLKNVELNLTEFKNYLRRTVGDKQYICQYLLTAKKLKNGDGIAYYGWPEGVLFRHPTFEDMSVNFFEMKEAYKLHEEKYGKMKSTLILTSIGKLEEFQVYLVAGILPNGMSDEQRGKLAGEELDLDEYKNFLINEYGLQGKYVDALCRRASDLKSGNGIRYRRWPDGAVFHPKPIGMDEDFHRLQQDAILHMRNHSTCHYSVLITPINKLMSFQEFYYKRKFASELAQDVPPSIDDKPSVQVEQPKAVLSMQPAAAEAAQHSIHPPGETKQETQTSESPTIREEQPDAVLSISEEEQFGVIV